MKNNEVMRAKQKLDKVFAKIDQPPKDDIDIELEAHIRVDDNVTIEKW